MKCLLLVCFIISGCQIVPAPTKQPAQMPILAYEADVSDYEIPEPESLLALTAEQVAEFRRFQLQTDVNTLLPFQQVKYFLEKRLVNFNYEGKNYSAAEALELNQGNCMSLALLTYAIASEFQVDISFQLLHTMPVLLDVTDRYSVTSDHVRSFLYETNNNESSTLFSGRKSVVIDYFPNRYDRGGKMIDTDEFFAMLYRNLAADALFSDDLPLAYLLLKKSLSFSKVYAPSINMLAVVLRRLGDVQTAENLYRYGLEVSEDKVTLLSNYHYLLVRQGRIVEALAVKKQLLELDDSSPYKWYLVAQDAIASGDYLSAKVFLHKFIDNTHYYHKAYFDLAKVHNELGEPELAKKALRKALDYTELPRNQQRYQAKLAWLKSR